MELADILSELWRRRRWLAVGLVVAVFAALSTSYDVKLGVPPKIQSQSYEVGAASVDILVDSPQSPIPDTGKEFEALQQRASVYAQLIRTAPIRQQIAKKMGIPWQFITAEGPTPVKAGNSGGQRVDAAPRANQLLAEERAYRLFTNPQANIPIISVKTQGPSAEGAVKLADASVLALQEYLVGLQRKQRVPRGRQVTVTRLAEPVGGVLTENPSTKAGVLAFFGVLFGWCVLVVLVSNVVTSLRRAQVVSQLNHGGELDIEHWDANGGPPEVSGEPQAAPTTER